MVIDLNSLDLAMKTNAICNMTEERDEIGCGDTAVKFNVAYVIVKQCDMPEEMATDCSDICSSACEKNPENNEAAARMIKDAMDKYYGPCWQVIVGEAFGFVVAYEAESLMHCFFGSNVGVCVWKCA